jgi:hypothetical protein
MAPTHNAISSVTCGASASEANVLAVRDHVCPPSVATDGGVVLAASNAARDAAMRIRMAVSASPQDVDVAVCLQPQSFKGHQVVGQADRKGG